MQSHADTTGNNGFQATFFFAGVTTVRHTECNIVSAVVFRRPYVGSITTSTTASRGSVILYVAAAVVPVDPVPRQLRRPGLFGQPGHGQRHLGRRVGHVYSRAVTELYRIEPVPNYGALRK